MPTLRATQNRWPITSHTGTNGFFAPLRWLESAFRVVRAVPGVSAAVGVGFTALAVAAYTTAAAMPLFTVTLATIMLALGAYLAAAAYSVAKQVTAGEQATLTSCARDVADRSLSIGVFVTVCGLLMAAWVRIAGLSFAVYYGTLGLNRAELLEVWSGDAPLGPLVFLAIATSLLAGILFAVSMVALPRIVDRNTNIVDAVSTGLRAIRQHPSAAAGFLLLVLLATGLALMTQMLLMPLVFPLLAFAAWFGYEEMARR